jgi:hypothetical protein
MQNEVNRPGWPFFLPFQEVWLYRVDEHEDSITTYAAD